LPFISRYRASLQGLKAANSWLIQGTCYRLLLLDWVDKYLHPKGASKSAITIMITLALKHSAKSKPGGGSKWTGLHCLLNPNGWDGFQQTSKRFEVLLGGDPPLHASSASFTRPSYLNCLPQVDKSYSFVAAHNSPDARGSSFLGADDFEFIFWTSSFV
jgi:hypothetical protein